MPAAIDEVTPELPVEIQADFSPMTPQAEIHLESDGAIDDSLQAQRRI